MTSRNLRKRSNTLLVKNFLKRLDQGVLLDRNHVHVDGTSRKKIAAPLALTKKRPRPTGTQTQANLKKSRAKSAARTRQRYDVLALIKRMEGKRGVEAARPRRDQPSGPQVNNTAGTSLASLAFGVKRGRDRNE